MREICGWKTAFFCLCLILAAPAFAVETAAQEGGDVVKPPEELNIPSLANERAFSASELETLQELDEKRVALERRAQALELREKLVDMLEERLAGRITELEALKAELKELLGSASGKDEEQLKQLAAVYGAMKPSAAANVLNRLDNTLVQDIVERLPSKKAGKLMEALEPAKARRISEMMANPLPVPEI
ncbi:MAG: hypothetical protein COY40_02985 [Alphaproteobacteria bacterium CG_4_10_14_0_8_um_filter_53_9]|nr:MAG: hypothetical protein COY40_02985 [Alphaproteobacteria bacterium CG_4_10_14_0_8_um_filter_53_9]